MKIERKQPVEADVVITMSVQEALQLRMLMGAISTNEVKSMLGSNFEALCDEATRNWIGRLYSALDKAKL